MDITGWPDTAAGGQWLPNLATALKTWIEDSAVDITEPCVILIISVLMRFVSVSAAGGESRLDASTYPRPIQRCLEHNGIGKGVDRGRLSMTHNAISIRPCVGVDRFRGRREAKDGVNLKAINPPEATPTTIAGLEVMGFKRVFSFWQAL